MSSPKRRIETDVGTALGPASVTQADRSVLNPIGHEVGSSVLRGIGVAANKTQDVCAWPFFRLRSEPTA